MAESSPIQIILRRPDGKRRWKEFRELPAKVQEASTSTNRETLRRVYDDVSPEDMREGSGASATGAEQKAA